MIDLDKLAREFKDKTGLTPIMATEIEFYFMPKDKEIHEPLLKELHQLILKNKIPALRVEFERGPNQLEVPLMHSPNIGTLAKNTAALKEIISEFAGKKGFTADFSAKPYKEYPGSGLHIHLSLLNSENKNIFAKEDAAEETAAMKHSVGGLLETMKEAMVYFAPYEKSYGRFVATFNEEYGTYDNAPTKICWGSNNRTVAVRIPSSTMFEENRHLEHRISGIDADPNMAIAAVLAGVLYGMENKIAPPEKIHGNAFDDIYDLPPLPKNLAEAMELNRTGEILKRYI